MVTSKADYSDIILLIFVITNPVLSHFFGEKGHAVFEMATR
jgi:hypothetical protein